MSHLRSIACVTAEERLLELEPAALSAALENDPSLRDHLGGCRGCTELAEGIGLLATPDEVPPLSDARCEATFLAAAGESRRLHAERRKAVARAGLKAGAIFLLWAPLVAAVAFGLLDWIRPLLTETAYLAVGWMAGLALLGGLSLLAFTLTLVAGAAAQPPRDPALLEV